MKICDVCKKELGIPAKVTIPWFLGERSITYDMCRECAKKVMDYIHALCQESEQKKEGETK